MPSKKKLVGIWIDEKELSEMQIQARIDQGAGAVLALARKGMMVERGEFIPRHLVEVKEASHA